MDILVGLFVIIIGLTLAISGLQGCFAMLPLVGFVTGFFAGATLITNWLSEGFFATATGWIVGIGLGIVFAAVSCLYWYISAFLAAGESATLILSDIFSAVGVNSGELLVTLAIVGPVLFIIAAVDFNKPVHVMLTNTAIEGALRAIGVPCWCSTTPTWISSIEVSPLGLCSTNGSGG
jgi:hypothetical protein